ncbi:MAG: GyrI-like domain-containing protein [Bacteroides sp.]|nr:GyrI-like domain-containing protein [Bacteroides sp.]
MPKYWDAVVLQAKERPVMGMYGVCFDEEMAGNQFRYMVADDFIAGQAEEKGLEVYDIPAHTWAVFPCRGAMPLPLQEVNRKIFSEWLPASSYEIAEGYNIEYYSNPADYKNGMQDPEYYSEVWIPVKKK